MERRAFLAVIAAAPLLLPATLTPHAEEGWDLITPEEYSRRTERQQTRNLTVERDAGPEIVLHRPISFELASPVDFDVEFRPRDNVAPDLATLRVEYDMGLFWQDVTKRLLGHARVTGLRLTSTGARLPPGRHVLRVRIMDKQRRATVSTLELTVAAGT